MMPKKRPFLVIVAGIILIVFAVVGDSFGKDSEHRGVVATVDGIPVTADEVYQAREERDLKHATMGKPSSELNKQALERVIRRRLVMLDVEKTGFIKGEKADELRSIMVPGIANVYQRYKQAIIIVSDKEIEDVVAKPSLERRKISYIVSTDLEALEEARQRAMAGEDFSMLAKEYSEGPASEKGGDLGYLDKNSKKYFPDEIWNSLFELDKGGITGIFPSLLFGHSFARVDDIQPYPPEEVEKVYNSVRKAIKAEKLEQEIAELVEKAVVKINRKNLSDLKALERESELATYAGGMIHAGYFKAFLRRIKIDVASADLPTLEEYLGQLVRSEIVANAREADLRRESEYDESIENARKNVIIRMYFDTLYDGIKVEDSEIERYYEENPGENRIPERVYLRQILLSGKEEADDVYKKLEKGEDFESLAIKYSEEEKAHQNAGYVGIVAKDAFPEFIAEVIFGLGITEYSRPVATRFGYYIFRVEKKYPKKELSLEERSQAIQKHLLEGKKESVFSKTLQRLKSEHEITIDDKALGLL